MIPNLIKLNGKTIGRLIAIQAFYQWKGFAKDVDPLTLWHKLHNLYQAGDLWEEEKMISKIKVNKTFSQNLLQWAIANATKYANLLENYQNKKHARALPDLLYAILVIALTELEYYPEAPDKAIINEYTNIASEMMCEDASVGFVNSILQRAAGERPYGG